MEPPPPLPLPPPTITGAGLEVGVEPTVCSVPATTTFTSFATSCPTVVLFGAVSIVIPVALMVAF
ncbi:hypothetical protein D3C73_1628830 [compost metagenome]